MASFPTAKASQVVLTIRGNIRGPITPCHARCSVFKRSTKWSLCSKQSFLVGPEPATRASFYGCFPARLNIWRREHVGRPSFTALNAPDAWCRTTDKPGRVRTGEATAAPLGGIYPQGPVDPLGRHATGQSKARLGGDICQDQARRLNRNASCGAEQSERGRSPFRQARSRVRHHYRGELSGVGIDCSGEDTRVQGHTRKHQRADVQLCKKQGQWRGKEGRMFRLEHRVVVRPGKCAGSGRP